MTNRIYRLPTLLDCSGDSRSGLYQRISQGLWTKPIKLGPRAAGWPECEVQALISARIAGASEEVLRELVNQLHQARTEQLPKL